MLPDVIAETAALCPACGCADQAGATAHAIRAALADGDLDGAVEAGLLECDPCAACANDCRAAVVAARDERQRALAARERHRARNARLQRRAAEREARRNPPDGAPTVSDACPALPAAAAAALARAKAKAAGRD